jgi:hypothetical protein
MESNMIIRPLPFADFTSVSCPSATAIELLHADAVGLTRGEVGSGDDVVAWCERAHELLSRIDARSEIDSWLRQLGRFFHGSALLDRSRIKPRNYAGDYLTIQMMYDAQPCGTDAFSEAVDRWALDQPAARAVRNRRRLVRQFIERVGEAFPADELSVASLGSGPAAEIFDILPTDRVRFHLIDIDDEALSFVQHKLAAAGALERVSLIRGNIIKMALGRVSLVPHRQHGFYSLGLIDYLDDQLVVRLLDRLHDQLLPGGRLMLGNFRTDHPNAAFFLHALDWPLILRSGDHLMDLVGRSRFAHSAVTIGAESEGVQLFLECRKD